MKTKLSPVEELKMERARLKEECQIHKDRIVNTAEYVKNNIGTVVLNSVVSSSRNGLQTMFSPTGKSKSLLDSPFFAALPTVWNIAQPFVIGWATKKITTRIFKRRKK